MVLRLLHTLLNAESNNKRRPAILYLYHENTQLAKYMLQYFCDLQQKLYRHICNIKKQTGK